MPVDRGSLLLGFVLGLAVAALLMASVVVLSTRQAFSVSQTNEATTSASPAPNAIGRPIVTPTPTPTATASATPTATPTATPRVEPKATPVAPAPALRYDSVEVPPRRFTMTQIPASPGQILELTVQVESDVDLTLFTPSGEPVVGPLRVQRAYSLRESSQAGGSWAVKLDNSFSWITTKQV
ncbi:MAG: hypothetical protein ACYC7H_11925, partial [Chloroflexota bacterium]